MGPFLPNEHTRPPAAPDRLAIANERLARSLRRLQAMDDHHYAGMRWGRMVCSCGWRTHHILWPPWRNIIDEINEHERIMGVD